MVVVVDAKNLLFRSHFAHESLKDSQGRFTGATYGLITSYATLRKSFPNARFIICWEGGCLSKRLSDGGSWRRSVYPEYKNNRTGEGTHIEALKQIPTIVELMNLLEVYQLEVGGLEADDVIALLAHRATEEVVIYSNDEDLTQLLVLPHVKWARPTSMTMERFEYVTKGAVVKKHGIIPEQWSRYRALCGDSSDNIKVLKGLGPVTAAKMVVDGVDTSLPTFSSLPKTARKKYPQLEVLWGQFHIAWQISHLPSSVRDLRCGRAQQLLVRDLLIRSMIDPLELDAPGKRAKRFMAICDEYDIKSFVGYVGKFFPLS